MSFKGQLESWKKEHNMHGPSAMGRFVMMKFLERVTSSSDDFVFKGGNLLWFYIKTPRPTVDIDFTTNTETDAATVIETLHTACESNDLGLSFKILNHKVIEENGKIGLAINIEYSLDTGSRNRFGVDIVLGVQTDINQIKINKQLINAASLENIIVDKLMASHTFGSGNTRAKDYDDLYRIADYFSELDAVKLVKIAAIKRVELNMDYRWISEHTSTAWERHLKQYRSQELPKDLSEVFDSINEFLNALKSKAN